MARCVLKSKKYVGTNRSFVVKEYHLEKWSLLLTHNCITGIIYVWPFVVLVAYDQLKLSKHLYEVAILQ